MPAINDLVPGGAEAGVGLALQDDCGRYLFLLAGTRFRCPPGELFYAGIGGHREKGESWPACALREAQEEIGADITSGPRPRPGTSRAVVRLYGSRCATARVRWPCTKWCIRRAHHEPAACTTW